MYAIQSFLTSELCYESERLTSLLVVKGREGGLPVVPLTAHYNLLSKLFERRKFSRIP